MQDYRKLRVWSRAHALAKDTRTVTRTFPRKGFTSLGSQVVRAAESVLFNIVEGCGANSAREFARFLEISCKSAMELESQLELARDYGVMSPECWIDLNDRVITLRRMLWVLREKVLTPSIQNSKLPTRNSKLKTGL